jgi:hypothetical protein
MSDALDLQTIKQYQLLRQQLHCALLSLEFREHQHMFQ